MCAKENKAEAVAKRRTVVGKSLSEELRSGQRAGRSEKELCKALGILGRGPEAGALLACLRSCTRPKEPGQSEGLEGGRGGREVGRTREQRATVGAEGECYCSQLLATLL